MAATTKKGPAPKKGAGATTETETETETATTETAEANAPNISLSDLFAAYETADDEYEAAKARVNELFAKRAECAKAILESYGKGPFLRKGDQVTVVKRQRNETTSYYVKGKTKSDGLVVAD